MSNLILLVLEDRDPIRCANLIDAKNKARGLTHLSGRILAEITPESGGPMVTLEFDKRGEDWIPA
jgi:hypothetical protein